jgi:hypothetical protein
LHNHPQHRTINGNRCLRAYDPKVRADKLIPPTAFAEENPLTVPFPAASDVALPQLTAGSRRTTEHHPNIGESPYTSCR